MSANWQEFESQLHEKQQTAYVHRKEELKMMTNHVLMHYSSSFNVVHYLMILKQMLIIQDVKMIGFPN